MIQSPTPGAPGRPGLQGEPGRFTVVGSEKGDDGRNGYQGADGFPGTPGWHPHMLQGFLLFSYHLNLAQTYRKLPIISPGLIFGFAHFFRAYFRVG